MDSSAGMKILCVIDSLGSGGAQRQMSYLVAGLKQKSHQVELFLYHPGQNHFRSDIDNYEIPIHEVPRSGHKGFSISVLWSLFRQSRQGFDAIISFQPTANIYSVMANVLNFRCKLIICERSAWAAPRGRIKRLLSWCAAIGANHVVCNSYSHAAHLSQLFCMSRRVHAIWNGYPKLPIMERGQCISGQLQEILIASRVSPEKNGLRLLEALALFFARNGWIPRVSWAGRKETDESSQNYYRVMEEFLTRNPVIASNWNWLGEVKDIQQLYAESDVLILPSLYEGLPNVVCEAMMTGCPVIASNVCDHPKLLGVEERGLLCDPLSPISICTALERFNVMSMEMKIQMVRQARDYVERYLGIERMVDSYEQLLVDAERNKLELT
tara:strand:- start:125501 stop:126649 length:1149 start_codon:yes stop_codon:yes gene_type:complete